MSILASICLIFQDSPLYSLSISINLFTSSLIGIVLFVLINLHMMPYFWEKDKEHGEKTRQKYQKLWGDELYNNVMKLHEADKKAH